jgi:hypothetical protein
MEYARGLSIIFAVAWAIPAVIVLALGLWGALRYVSSSNSRWKYQEFGPYVVLGSLAWGAWLAAMPLFQLRYIAASAVAARLDPAIAALQRYRAENGAYPDSLANVIPGYLPVAPSTRALAYPDYVYVRAGSRSGSGGYELIVPMPHGGSFDELVYWPSENYPAVMSPGEVVRLGRWVYVLD